LSIREEASSPTSLCVASVCNHDIIRIIYFHLFTLTITPSLESTFYDTNSSLNDRYTNEPEPLRTNG